MSKTLGSPEYVVVAHTGPGSANNARYQLLFSQWEASDSGGELLFSRVFSRTATDQELQASLLELQNILGALFLSDSIPRKLNYFEYSLDLDNVSAPTFGPLRVFGAPQSPIERLAFPSLENFMRVGFVGFNRPLDYVPPDSEVQSWYQLLESDSRISSSIQLIQESFSNIHMLTSIQRPIRLAEICSAILLLVSGLETLFRRNEDSNADISFKFRTVGSAFYSHYVTQDQISDFLGQQNKFTYQEFNAILNALYSLRSDIAHGDLLGKIFDNKTISKLNRFFRRVGVGEVQPQMPTIVYSHLLLAMQKLEPHLLALIRCSGENLKKGVQILDDLL